MGYLRTRAVKVEGHDFELRELSHADYRYVVDGEDAWQSMRAVCRGVTQFHGRDEQELAAELPVRIVAKLATEVLKLAVPEDLLGNSESAPTEGSSSD